LHLEAAGYDGAWSAESSHNAFLPLVAAASSTSRISLGTGVAVAFARSPMTLAVVANDLQLHSRGRFVLGIGSQVRPHIENRYSMPWSHPAARMRELVVALQHIWASWNERKRLDFRGEFYTHTLMTPFFDPGPNPFGIPKVFVAAVGPRMTAAAAEVASGLVLHSFSTERYLRGVIMPIVEQRLAAAGRDRADFEIAYPVFVATGRTEAEVVAAADAVRKQIAFYGSTPGYRPVLEVEGWGELQPELNRLSKAGAWDDMEHLIDERILNAFALVGEPEVVAAELSRRLSGVADRVSFYAPYPSAPQCWDRLVDAIRREGSNR
jgi:probable F420-dependent oxidoreductase